LRRASGAFRRNHRADRGPQGEEQGQRRERIEIFRSAGFEQITVEHDVGGGGKPALDQIHDQEGEIVEQVA